MKNYVDIANGYIDDVLSGKILTGKPIRQACQRQRADLKHSKYTFDPDRANHVCRFVELLPHVKGRFGGNIVLEPWQIYLLTTAFGWIDRNGNRRFRKVFAEVARKNAKALALTTPIPTPTGWSTIKDIQPGDQVIGGDGKPCNVRAVSKIFRGRKCYIVAFSNDDEIIADANHTWKIREQLRPQSTRQLFDRPPPTTIAAAPPFELPHDDTLGDCRFLGKFWAYEGGPIPDEYLRGSLNQRQDLIYGLAINLESARRDRLRAAADALADELAQTTDTRRLCFADSDLARAEHAASIGRPINLATLVLTDPLMVQQVAELLRTIQAQQYIEDIARPTDQGFSLDARIADHFTISDVRETRSVPTKCLEVDSPNNLFLAGRSMVPTHNSTISSGVALYSLLCDDEPGARVVSAATTRDQARLTLDDARQMVKASPGMQKRFGVGVSAHTVFCESSNSNFRSLSRESSTMDGINPSFVLLDEVHAMKSRSLLDVLTSAQGARSQPLMWMITTAGVDLSGIGFEEHTYSLKVLDKTVEDDRRFVAIYTLDPEDDWQDSSIWIKANPNLGVSVYRDHLEGEYTKAAAMASAINGFKTKHLDIWCASNHALFDMQSWAKCEDDTLTPDQFKGEPCVIGLDLASKKDLSAKILLFEKAGHYYVFARHYLPVDTVTASTNSAYSGWHKDGHLTATDGAIVDYNKIQDDIRQDCRDFTVTEVAYDPFQATQLAGTLMNENVSMVEVKNTVLNLSEPTKELEALILAGRIHHNGDPVLRWCFSNVVGHIDAKDNIYPRRESESSKIDSAVATIMTLAIYIHRANQRERDYQFMVV